MVSEIRLYTEQEFQEKAQQYAAVAEIQVATLLKQKKLIHVLPEWHLSQEDVFIVTPSRQYRTLALRLCLDFLKNRIPERIDSLK